MPLYLARTPLFEILAALPAQIGTSETQLTRITFLVRTAIALTATVLLGSTLAACGNDVVVFSSGCDSGGNHYSVGDKFASADGCNTCECTEEYGVICSEMGCPPPPPTTCKYNGKTYQVGDSFPDVDDCNDCSCMQDGTVACTLLDCYDCEYNGESYQVGDSFPAGDGCNQCACTSSGVSCTDAYCETDCVYAGQSYSPGQSFPAVDGCNTCTCQEDGSVGCTELACDCNPDKEWYRKYVSLDPKECELIDYGCPPNTFGFQNACGCGCEQDPSCPEWFNCMPPNGCDVEAIKKKCPYSGIAV